MKRKTTGRKHFLLLYKRMMDRLWGSTLILGTLMLVLWFWSDFFFPALPPIFALALLVGAFFVLGFTIFALLARKMAYVKVFPDHLRLVTPFLNLKISYRRLLSSHPTELYRLYPPAKAHWAEHRFMEPFYDRTAVVVEFNQYPMSQKFLSLFLLPQMFSPQATALVFIVQDWMSLSTEIDSALSTWKQDQNLNQRANKGGYGMVRLPNKR